MRHRTIYILIFSMVILLAIGFVMLSSTGAFAADNRGDMHYFLKRQALWLAVGTVALLTAAILPYQVWQRLWPWVFGLAAVLLVLCYIPPIGKNINGANRWIGLGGITLQPSEMAKIAAVMFLAAWSARYEEHAREFWRGLALPLMIVGVLMALIVFEVDLGTTALLGVMSLCVLFIAGAGLRWLVPMLLVGLAGLVAAIFSIDERHGRLVAFLDPERYRLGEGHQQLQALIAFGSGGIEGLGLGNGRQKMLYLPYAHTDFIFPMIGEELGLGFTLLTVLCFLLILLAGTLVSMNARDRFGMVLGFGATILVALQAAVNIGVTTSLLPNKGMPLPFISYGGSNLVLCMFIVGLLVSIHRQGRRAPHARPQAWPVTGQPIRL